MRFRLDFDMDNAAFEDNPAHETEVLLRQVAYAISHGARKGAVRDSNGNTVGSWEIEE